jgi:hypothetical protein
MKADVNTQIDGRNRSAHAFHMFAATLAIYYLNEKHIRLGTKSGYEEIIRACPPKMIEMAQYLIEKLSAKDQEVAEWTAELSENPELYIEKLETKTAFRRRELAFFQFGKAPAKKPNPSLARSGISSHYLGRKKYIDRKIEEAIQKGVKQIVIPACGLDTVAERYASEHPDVHFYLSDLSSVIEERRGLMDETFYEKFFDARKPDNIHYDSVDLEIPSSLANSLNFAKGFNKKAKTLYIFEGISMYLAPGRIRSLFDEIKKTTPLHEMIVGIILYATKAERATTNGTYKAILPLYKILKDLVCDNSTGKRRYAYTAKSPYDLQDGLVNWRVADGNYRKRRPELFSRRAKTMLTLLEVKKGRLAYQVSHETFFHFVPI